MPPCGFLDKSQLLFSAQKFFDALILRGVQSNDSIAPQYVDFSGGETRFAAVLKPPDSPGNGLVPLMLADEFVNGGNQVANDREAAQDDVTV
jgi:hypothetical protein